MLNLIRNENMKLYGRINTWIMLGLLVIFIIVAGILTKTMTKVSTENNWKESLQKQSDTLKTEMSQMPDIKASKDAYDKTIKTNDYRIEHNLPPVGDNTVWGFASSSASLVSLISLFTIIIGAGMVANEFSEGTIKLLLIRPSSRWKILLSKYISTLLSTLLMLVILFIISFLTGGILFGFSGLSQPYLSYSGGKITEVSMISHVFVLYGYKCVDLIMMATAAFMISTVFRNSSLAIGLSIFLMFTGSTLVQFLSRYNWVKYILFANTDLTVYSDGTPLVKGMTLGFSIAVLVVYYVIFNLISWVGFTKRDVAA